MRHMIGAFDEFASDVNAEQVATMMIVNAEAGYWNGSRAPFGYKTVAAAIMGKKIKKVLPIDLAEAAVVRRIFDLYLHGEGGRLLGLKAICTKLNAENVRLRHNPFLCCTLSDLLRRKTYAGTFYYNQKDSRTSLPRDRSEWIAVKVPAIINEGEYDEVQARLAMHHPRVTAPRTVSSPTLLASVGICGECSAGLLLQTGKGGRSRYYTCRRKRTESVAACGLKARPTAEVDAVVIAALEHHVLAPDRIEALLVGLLDKSSQASAERVRDLATLRAERTQAEAALRSVWTMIESGYAAAADADVAERMALHRSRLKQLSIEIRVLSDQQAAPARRITPEIVQRFVASVR